MQKGTSLTQRETAELSGKTVDALFPLLLRFNRDVVGLRFESFTSGPGISERVQTTISCHPEWIDPLKPLLLTPEPGISSWDKLATKVMSLPNFEPLPEDILQAVIRHAANPTDTAFEVSQSELTDAGISKLIAQIGKGQILAVCSKASVKSSDYRHIPMLDFLCPCSESNRVSIIKMLRRIGQDSGVIVESGQSYHYYGFRLLNQEDWVKFMGKALMFAPFSDPRYIAHRLVDGQCRLRVYSESRPMPRISQVL